MLDDYVQKAKAKGLSIAEIRERLLAVGWPAHEVYTATESDEDLRPPLPTSSASLPSVSKSSQNSQTPITVESSGFSAIGFEYLIYFIALGIAALSFGALLHNIVNLIYSTEKYSFYDDIIPVATAAIIVSLPIFIMLMFRLKKRERQDPDNLHDKTRRRAVQLLMLVTFLVGVIKLIAYLYNIINPDASVETNILAETIHGLVTIGIAGGIFVNYWLEQAKLNK